MLLLKEKWPLVTNYSVNHDMVPSGERSSHFSKVTWAISNHLRWQIYILKPGLKHSTRILTSLSQLSSRTQVLGSFFIGHLYKTLQNLLTWKIISLQVFRTWAEANKMMKRKKKEHCSKSNCIIHGQAFFLL